MQNEMKKYQIIKVKNSRITILEPIAVDKL